MTKGERESRVRYGIWRNWGDDDVYKKATFWNRKVCGDGQRIFYAEGASRDVRAWGVWDKGDQ